MLKDLAAPSVVAAIWIARWLIRELMAYRRQVKISETQEKITELALRDSDPNSRASVLREPAKVIQASKEQR